jgi:hypothetical protein
MIFCHGVLVALVCLATTNFSELHHLLQVRIDFSDRYLIEAAAFEVRDKKCAAIVEEMSASVRDTFMGSEWKSTIPSVDEINEALK